MINYKCIQKAEFLPLQWDKLADNYFQQTKFLLHTEQFNPCKQRYYLCFEKNELVSAAIVYTLQIDFFTFAKLKGPVKMHIAGVPCSVSSQGIFGDEHAMTLLKQHIYKKEKGFVLFLNLKEKPGANTFAYGNTLPTIVLSNRFKNWDDYIASLRSNYRRRLKQINSNNENLRFTKIRCSEFTHEMHQQYLNVYKRSSGKLEKLHFDFFKNLPSEFKLTVCIMNEKVIGWNIVLEDRGMFYFFLGGIDYMQNKNCNTYLRLLTGVVREGIESKAQIIELGQTAEIAKMRMGGTPQPLYMEAHHSLKVLNFVIKICRPMLEYKRMLENTNALKELSS
jgi:hypothetical protein